MKLSQFANGSKMKLSYGSKLRETLKIEVSFSFRVQSILIQSLREKYFLLESFQLKLEMLHVIRGYQEP